MIRFYQILTKNPEKPSIFVTDFCLGYFRPRLLCENVCEKLFRTYLNIVNININVFSFTGYF